MLIFLEHNRSHREASGPWQRKETEFFGSVVSILERLLVVVFEVAGSAKELEIFDCMASSFPGVVDIPVNALLDWGIELIKAVTAFAFIVVPDEEPSPFPVGRVIMGITGVLRFHLFLPYF